MKCYFSTAQRRQQSVRLLLTLVLLFVLLSFAAAVPTRATLNRVSADSLFAVASTSGTIAGTNLPVRSLNSRSGFDASTAVSSSLGGVLVSNNCPFEIHGSIVHAPREKGVIPEEETHVLGPGSENVEDPYSHDPKVGVSWKFTRKDAAGTMQVEWMWSPDQEKVFWDLSMVDGQVQVNASLLESRNSASDRDAANTEVAHSFYPYGVAVVPVSNERIVTQGNGEGNCAPIECSPGQGVCQSSYNAWNDWEAQRDCHQKISLKVELCS